MKIFVSRISQDVSDNELRKLFEAFGFVSFVEIIKDKFTGESRGFGFVVMPIEREAKTAVKRLNGKEFRGLDIQVNEARTHIQGSGSADKRKRINGFINSENALTDFEYSLL